MTRIEKIGAALLLFLLLPGCAGMGASPSGKEGEDALSVAALFQTEGGDALSGSAACFSVEANNNYVQVDNDGTASVTGLPRSGELLLTLFDQQQKIQGAMTLSFGQGAVTDAMTGADGVGHITVRKDASKVALVFILTEDGALRCALWLGGTVPSRADLPETPGRGEASCGF